MSPSTRRTAMVAAVVPALAAVVAVVTLAVTDAPSAPSANGSSADGDAIVIRNFVYEPTALVVRRGTPVTVTNADGTRHTVTADNGSFDTGDLDGNARATLVVDRPGRFAYHCAIHDYMKGTIEVRG